MTSRPYSLMTNGRSAPLGIGTEAPEFAWRLSDGMRQDAYQIEVATTESFSEADLAWPVCGDRRGPAVGGRVRR